MPTIPAPKSPDPGPDPGKPPWEYPSDDNWRHRSAQMKCQTCMWYVAKRAALGRCRRRAPTLSGWPAVFESDWCGDHKLNEEDVG